VDWLLWASWVLVNGFFRINFNYVQEWRKSGLFVPYFSALHEGDFDLDEGQSAQFARITLIPPC